MLTGQIDRSMPDHYIMLSTRCGQCNNGGNEREGMSKEDMLVRCHV